MFKLKSACFLRNRTCNSYYSLLFETVLPEISRLCISSQSVLTQPIPLLRRMRGGGADEDADNSSDPDVSVRSLTFSQSQVSG